MTQKYGFLKSYFDDYKVVPDKKVRPMLSTALHCDGYNKMARYNDVGCATVTLAWAPGTFTAVATPVINKDNWLH